MHRLTDMHLRTTILSAHFIFSVSFVVHLILIVPIHFHCTKLRLLFTFSKKLILFSFLFFFQNKRSLFSQLSCMFVCVHVWVHHLRLPIVFSQLRLQLHRDFENFL
eukprot:TRINITY_DN11310_c0_g1_i1.p3 TRINITY_DN11310_c0_g1~~TRINITY_DN11310_c0_g1_i1.p3  ORF type:complete len:106 (-),score=8.49 TRINITY_DN11310_c0_g1_i1:2929-3246(-)